MRIPPLLLVALAAALMWVIARSSPSPGLPGGWPLAGVVLVAGAGLALAGVREFRRARTTVNPMNPTRATELVSDGVYRHTRNPMYLGFAIMLAGWGIALGSAAALTGVGLFVLAVDRLQIVPEEAALERLFGERYLAYRSRVRRWL
jgi:protein-S-isoprenylcysteine O-methyltransferase Ste14